MSMSFLMAVLHDISKIGLCILKSFWPALQVNSLYPVETILYICCVSYVCIYTYICIYIDPYVYICKYA